MDLNDYGNDYSYSALGLSEEPDFIPKQNKFKELNNINREIAISEEKLRSLNNSLEKKEEFMGMGLKPDSSIPPTEKYYEDKTKSKSSIPNIKISFEGMILMVLLVINIFIMITISRVTTPVMPYYSGMTTPPPFQYQQ